MATRPFANEVDHGSMDGDNCLEFLSYEDFGNDAGEFLSCGSGIEEHSSLGNTGHQISRSALNDQRKGTDPRLGRTTHSKTRDDQSIQVSRDGTRGSTGQQEVTAPVASGPRGKKKTLKKSPDAPIRFKNPYIFFVQKRMASLKSVQVTVPEKMSQVAAEWAALSPTSKQEYERYAEADKARYFDEMKNFSGPTHVPNIRAKKHPGAPKRAMSAFLGFSQAMRPKLRTEFPAMKNTDVSIVLAQRWKEATEDERKAFVDKEVCDRRKYHEDMSKWKAKEGENTASNAAAIQMIRSEFESLKLQTEGEHQNKRDRPTDPEGSSSFDLKRVMRQHSSSASTDSGYSNATTRSQSSSAVLPGFVMDRTRNVTIAESSKKKGQFGAVFRGGDDSGDSAGGDTTDPSRSG